MSRAGVVGGDGPEDTDQEVADAGDEHVAPLPGSVADKAIHAIAAAQAQGDYAAVVALAAPFEKHTAAADVMEPGVLDLHVSAANALLKLGRANDAAAKVRWIESIYGPQASLAFTAATIFRFQKNTDAALRVINDGLCALAADGANQRSADLIVLKAEILLERGDGLQARALLAESLTNWRSFALFKLLRRTIASREEVIEFENIVLPNLHRYGAHTRNALYHYSYLQREFDNFERAISIARERFFAVIKRYPLGSVPKASGGSWIKEAEVALADLQDEFKASGLEFFLISGTLLGCVREKGILGHDKDIDVGVTEDIGVATVYEAMKNSKRFSVRPIASEHSVYIEHSNGVKIDVFRHFMRDGRYYHEGPKVAWWNTPFNLVRTQFLGREYLIPDNTDVYLTENYGTWRVPNSEFETFVDTPNMEVRNSEYLVWYYFLNLADHFVWGKMGQFRRVWGALSKLYPVDAFLTATVNDILANEEKYRQMPAAMLTRNIRRGVLPVTDDGELPGLDASVDSKRTHVPSLVDDILRALRRSPVTGDEAFVEAASFYRLLLAKPNAMLLRWRFARAAASAGRAKMALGQYVEACQVWYSLRRVARNKSRANRNLTAAALKGARAAEAAGDRQTAFLLWRFLRDAQPDSQAAIQGLVRCAGA